MVSATARTVLVVLTIAGCSTGDGANPGDDSPITPVAISSPHPVRTQARPEKPNVDAFATQQYHGVGAIPVRVRLAVASDTQVIRRYAEWLVGRRAAPLPWDTATVLWWLAESDDSSYVPLFVNFSKDSNDQVQLMALYGLARHAANAAARERLLDIVANPSSRHQKFNVAVSLLYVGDPAARQVLARVSTANLPRYLAAEIQWVRSQPAPERHKGRWPCSGDRVLRRSADGAHRCQHTVARP
jgi:hypothetical protein